MRYYGSMGLLINRLYDFETEFGSDKMRSLMRMFYYHLDDAMTDCVELVVKLCKRHQSISALRLIWLSSEVRFHVTLFFYWFCLAYFLELTSRFLKWFVSEKV